MAAGKTDTVVAQGRMLNLGDNHGVDGITNNLASVTSTGSGAVWASINGDTTTFTGGSGGGNILTVYETTGGVPASQFPDGGAAETTPSRSPNVAAIYKHDLDPVLMHDFHQLPEPGL